MNTPERLSELYPLFEHATIPELEAMLARAETREEKILWRSLLNLKFQLAQERIVGERLL
ncbi:MAG: hypothetical protein E7618_00945 [Ruminococcaceae bacterium]|nr:hypothetical protein [Oscillospiraceae bacterium]